MPDRLPSWMNSPERISSVNTEEREELCSSQQPSRSQARSHAFSLLPENSDVGSAFATDKSALVSGTTATTATFSDVSDYTDGINGILIDFANLPEGVMFSATDFAFKVGDTSNTSSSSSAPAPAAVPTWPRKR